MMDWNAATTDKRLLNIKKKKRKKEINSSVDIAGLELSGGPFHGAVAQRYQWIVSVGTRLMTTNLLIMLHCGIV